MQIYILMSVVNYRRKVLRGSCKQMLAIYVPTTVTIKQFLTSGTWTAPPYTTSVEYLVVGGGGGSGATHDGGAAGGGGGGMVLSGTATVLPGTAYTITVGAGGLGGIGYPSGNVPRETHGQSGGNSVFNGFIALGGQGIGKNSSQNSATVGGHFTVEPKFVGSLEKWILSSGLFTIVNGKLIGTKTKKGKPILLEDLMGENYLDLDNDAYGIMVPGDEILMRTKYEWFAVLPTEQLLKANPIIMKYIMSAHVDESFEQRSVSTI